MSRRHQRTFFTRYGPWAVVAGASNGIGRAFSNGLCARGLNLVLIARLPEELAVEAQLLRSRYDVQVVTAPVDLGAADAGGRLLDAVGDRDVGLLVYNACHSVVGPFRELSIADKLTTVDVNCRGALVASSLLGERLIQRGRGGLLFMSSLSGFSGTGYVATYAATKAFTTVLGEALWSELGPHGVHVLVCAAGATNTPGFLRQTPEAQRARAFPMQPEAVAEGALRRLGRGPTYIPGRVNRAFYAATKLLPRGVVARFVSENTRKMYSGGA